MLQRINSQLPEFEPAPENLEEAITVDIDNTDFPAKYVKIKHKNIKTSEEIKKYSPRKLTTMSTCHTTKGGEIVYSPGKKQMKALEKHSKNFLK